MSIEEVRQRHETRLMSLPNVTGVGIGEKAGRAVIKVFVAHKVPESELRPEHIIPKSIDGCRIDVEEIGTVTAGG